MAVKADKTNFDIVQEISKEHDLDFKQIMDIINTYVNKKFTYLLAGKLVFEGKLGVSKLVMRNVKHKVGDGVSPSYKIHTEISPIFLSKMKKEIADHPEIEKVYRENSKK